MGNAHADGHGESAGSVREEAWSVGVMARSLLLAGQPDQAQAAAERSIRLCDTERWNAFLPARRPAGLTCAAAACLTVDV
jgi:hypothetical protein